MRTLFWLVLVGSFAAIFFILRHLLRKHAERERAEEERAAAFLAQMTGARPAPAAAPLVPAPAPPASGTLEQQKLLFDAARKAGEAGEPALAIQLYARLLARFPDSGFAAEVRATVEVLRKKISKP